MTDREAMKQALEALESEHPEIQLRAAIALRERLAQPEQEPVLWLNEEKKIIYWHNTHETDDYHGFKRTVPLYTTPPQRKPLTENELFKLWVSVPAETEDRFAFARAIEAAHGIKGEA